MLVQTNCFFYCVKPKNLGWKGLWNHYVRTIPVRYKPPISRFNVAKWEFELKDNPDSEFKSFILNGLSNGFAIGNNGTIATGKDKNLPTSEVKKVAITNWLFSGVKKGFILGPFTEGNCPIKNVIISPLGAVPKDGNGWRPIQHLSAPRDVSGVAVNETLVDWMKHPVYPLFRDIVKRFFVLGVGAYLWVIDAADAYLRVPVQTSDWKFLAVRWNGLIFILTCLVFGLSSAPWIYTKFADAIVWVVKNNNKELFKLEYNGEMIDLIDHFLDDNFGGHSTKELSTAQFNAVLKTFSELQVPPRMSKVSPPNTRQKLLGSIYDTVTQKVYLPDKKHEEYRCTIRDFLKCSKKRFTKQELQSLVGKLRFICKHLWCGESFVRPIEVLLSKLKQDGHRTRLNAQCRACLNWFDDILYTFKTGLEFKYILYPRKSCNFFMYTDAYLLPDSKKGEAGLGGYNSVGNWFQFRVNVKVHFAKFKYRPDINWLEMTAVLVGLLLWGHLFESNSVHIFCDNKLAVGQIIKRHGPLGRIDLFNLILEVTKVSFKEKMHFYIEWLEGVKNGPADALSRFLPNPFKLLHEDLRMRMDSLPSNCDTQKDFCFGLYAEPSFPEPSFPT